MPKIDLKAQSKYHAQWFNLKKVPSLVLDHDEMIDAAMAQLRRKARYQPIGFELLPEKYRQAVYLTDIVGLSQKELAKSLGISYSGAKSRVQRGREKLKEIILQCCEVQADGYGNILGYHPRNPEPKKEECCD